jgi:hypothetical protein
MAWLNEIPWYGKLILAGGVLLLFVFTYQQGQLKELKKITNNK